METIIVHADSAEQVKLVQSFLQLHKLKSRILSEDDKEDIVLGRLMEETDYNDIVDTETFINNLRQ